MLFIVTIYTGSRLLWRATVEAEDRDGARREALHLMEAGGGTLMMGRYRITKASDLRVEVEGISRGE